jgi:hypothetical protein
MKKLVPFSIEIILQPAIIFHLKLKKLLLLLAAVLSVVAVVLSVVVSRTASSSSDVSSRRLPTSKIRIQNHSSQFYVAFFSSDVQ